MLSELQIKALFQSIEDIGNQLLSMRQDLDYLATRERKKEAYGGKRLSQYKNPHFSEVVDLVETILRDAGKPMSAPDLYLELGRRSMDIRSVNPAKYLATILDREQHKSKAKFFYARGSTPGWRLKALVHVTVNKVPRVTVDENGNEY